jgi:hypothetical protein
VPWRSPVDGSGVPGLDPGTAGERSAVRIGRLTPITLGPVRLLPRLDDFCALTVRTLHRDRDHRLPPRTICMQRRHTGKLLICNITRAITRAWDAVRTSLSVDVYRQQRLGLLQIFGVNTFGEQRAHNVLYGLKPDLTVFLYNRLASRNTYSTLPSRIFQPSLSKFSAMRRPFTYVPVALCRSVRMYPCLRHCTRACRAAIEG